MTDAEVALLIARKKKKKKKERKEMYKLPKKRVYTIYLDM